MRKARPIALVIGLFFSLAACSAHTSQGGVTPAVLRTSSTQTVVGSNLDAQILRSDSETMLPGNVRELHGTVQLLDARYVYSGFVSHIVVDPQGHVTLYGTHDRKHMAWITFNPSGQAVSTLQVMQSQ
jgi:hypothetical protein